MSNRVRRGPPSPEEGTRKGEGRATTLLKIAGALVTVISGAVGLLFIFLPQLRPDEPAQDQQAMLSQPRLEPNISRGQYLERADKTLEGFTKSELAARGAFIELRVEVVGYKGELLVLKWELIDASSGDELHEERSDGFVPPGNVRAATEHLFVPLPRRSGPFFVRIELLREGQYGPVSLASTRTKRFFGLV